MKKILTALKFFSFSKPKPKGNCKNSLNILSTNEHLIFETSNNFKTEEISMKEKLPNINDKTKEKKLKLKRNFLQNKIYPENNLENENYNEKYEEEKKENYSVYSNRFSNRQK